MANNRRSQRKNQGNNKKRKLSKDFKPENKTLEKKKLGKTPVDNVDTKIESESERIQKLLEPYSKDQLIDFLCDAAVNDSSLFQRIKTTADKDVSHRKIFVHGLSWDTTRETLYSAFQSYGEIEDCKLVTDRDTGRSKGYGFVLFKSRIGAEEALKNPQKKISNRVAACQLASIGPVAPTQQNHHDNYLKKIYVSNVHVDADPEKLRTFFGKFGEIETGPLGFDTSTGKSRGFAIFVYKSPEGAKKALAEPYKMFEGHQLHCQRVSENKNKPSTQQEQRQLPMQPQTLAAAAAAQNLALFNQHPSLNPMYSGLVANSNPCLIPGTVNPLMAGTFNPGFFPPTQMGGGSFGGGLVGGHSGILGGNPSIPGALASMNPALHGLQAYQNSHLGQSSSSRIHGASGSLTGYPSYIW
ncbi:RNA recognition motif domain [Macleaya cordata]|uniref:RNA recognition motif domain n=1 Tax=Macleaya cordata TaxID=56857 RepID=A0A200PQ93_MACCD|nr:RNA recognition motif domain [Macleaya cordata]